MIVSRQGLGASMAISIIAGYQKFVSPYKGFHCAFRRVKGGPGCSEFGKQAIREHGLIAGLRMIRQRFRECAAASQELGESASKEPTMADANPANLANFCASCGCRMLSEIVCCSS